MQRASESGLLPVAVGSDRPHLANMEMARIVIVATADCGLGNAAASLRTFERLETQGGLQFGDWLESLFLPAASTPMQFAGSFFRSSQSNR